MKAVYQSGLEDGASIAINHAILVIMDKAKELSNSQVQISDIIHLANTLVNDLEQDKVLTGIAMP